MSRYNGVINPVVPYRYYNFHPNIIINCGFCRGNISLDSRLLQQESFPVVRAAVAIYVPFNKLIKSMRESLFLMNLKSHTSAQELPLYMSLFRVL
jgi:hypothetical protein